MGGTGESYTFVSVEPAVTSAAWPINVSWTSKEDGGPVVYLWYPSAPAQGLRWTLLSFRDVAFFRYHSEHVAIEDTSESVQPSMLGQPWHLTMAVASSLKNLVASAITTTDRDGEPNWYGYRPSDLVHYRLSRDHDGHYDVVCSG